MWSSIIGGIISLLSSLLGLLKNREEQKIKEVEQANTAEEKAKQEVIQEVEVKDDAEKLIKDIQDAPTEAEREKALDELRRMVS